MKKYCLILLFSSLGIAQYLGAATGGKDSGAEDLLFPGKARLFSRDVAPVRDHFSGEQPLKALQSPENLGPLNFSENPALRLRAYDFLTKLDLCEFERCCSQFTRSNSSKEIFRFEDPQVHNFLSGVRDSYKILTGDLPFESNSWDVEFAGKPPLAPQIALMEDILTRVFPENYIASCGSKNPLDPSSGLDPLFALGKSLDSYDASQVGPPLMR